MPQLEDWLYTDNSFGTWTDMIHGKIVERVGVPLGWKKVGSDLSFMPTTAKSLEFLQRNTDMLEALGVDVKGESE
jgi:hypothetical protein